MMAKRGRPANNQPATLYDYRRLKALVDVLSMPDYQSLPALELLALAWTDLSLQDVRASNTLELVRRLAQHCLEHGRE